MNTFLIRIFAIAFSLCISYASKADTTAIESFAKQVYFEGIPYQQAATFDSDIVPYLVDILDDEASSEYWGNAAVILSIVGETEDFSHIVEFIERGFKEGHPEIYLRAQEAAIMAIGYFINRADTNKEALLYLVNSLQVENWDKRNIAGLSRDTLSYEQRNIKFSKAALLGLALAGTAEAENAILKFQANGNRTGGFATLQQRRYYDSVKGNITGLLEENRKVQAKGMMNYQQAR